DLRRSGRRRRRRRGGRSRRAGYPGAPCRREGGDESLWPVTSPPLVRVGVLGAGTWARSAHLPGYRRDPRCRIVAVCDVPIDRAREAARAFDVPTATANPRDLFERDDIDLIHACPPRPT